MPMIGIDDGKILVLDTHGLASTGRGQNHIGVRDEALKEARPDHGCPPTAIASNVVQYNDTDIGGHL